MTTLSVVYHSGTGHTAKLAEAVAKGASSVADVKVQTIVIQGKDIIEGRFKNPAVMEQLDASDAIIFGSPTYMGGPSGQFKSFADATAERWFGGKWKDKVASGFSVSSSPSGDKVQHIAIFFHAGHAGTACCGSVWVKWTMQPNGVNRLGSFSAARWARPDRNRRTWRPTKPIRLTGEVLGRRVAQAAKRWNSAKA